MPVCCDCGATFGTPRTRSPRCEDCRKEHDRKKRREYNARAREAEGFLAWKREYNRAWREAHPEKSREASREYAKRRPDKVREKNRRWRQANPEAVRERHRAYREAHREELNARLRVYRETHKDILREKRLHRNKLKRMLKRAGSDPEAWLFVKGQELRECKRLRIRALNLPCGKHEGCIGCPESPHSAAHILGRGAWKRQRED